VLDPADVYNDMDCWETACSGQMAERLRCFVCIDIQAYNGLVRPLANDDLAAPSISDVVGKGENGFDDALVIGKAGLSFEGIALLGFQ
jgi:hypothetical protein